MEDTENVVRCPVGAMIGVRLALHSGDINGMRSCVASASLLGASVGIELDDISCSTPIPQLIKPGLHTTANNALVRTQWCDTPVFQMIQVP
jgi:hypothetical protein